MFKTPTYTPDSDSDDDTVCFDDVEEDTNIESESTSEDEDRLSYQSSQSTDSPLLDMSREDMSNVSSPSTSSSPAPIERQRLVLQQPQFGDANYLKPGDFLAIVLNDMWTKVVLINHTGRKQVKHNSLYWNYKTLDGTLYTGSYLVRGQSWGVLRDEWRNVVLSEIDIVLPTT